MYIVKTKYSLENNIEPLSLLEKAKEMSIDTLLIADEGPYSWLEFDKWNKDFHINVLYAINKERNGVRLIWIPQGDVLKNVAKLEAAYRTNQFHILNKKDFNVLLIPSSITKKEVIQKELDTLKWLKTKVEKLYLLDRKESFHNIRILKEKTGVHSLSLKEVMYLDPTERDTSLMRKAIKFDKLIEDDYRSFMLPIQFLEKEMEPFEFKRTKRFLNEIKQTLLVDGHSNFKEKKMEFWNREEVERTEIPSDWTRFFGREIKIPESKWEQKKLALLCYKAGNGFNKQYTHAEANRSFSLERLKHELSVIAEKGFYTYFLMVDDFIRFCREKNIRLGKGRGSVVGSVLAYCLDIIEIDPITYELKFERFLNPFRSNSPDIDLDLPPSQIHILFDYVKEKYGGENVSKILTFNTFGVISAIQSVKNVYKIKERIELWFPKGLNNLDEFLSTDEGKKVKQRLVEKGYDHILPYINGISVLPQALSVHPAGVIISQELNELPLIDREGDLVLPFTKHNDQLERLGVTKFDFLTVVTLDIGRETEEIREKNGKPLYKLNFSDEKTLDLFRSGNTYGVFQVSSKGMRNTCKIVKPTKFEDIMDIISLYRPGPMEEIPKYVENKEKGSWSFEKLDPNSPEFKDIVPILGKTHGIIIYQEQIMEIASVWAGYTLGEADLLRRAISEKKRDLMEEEKKIFIERSIQNGRERKVTEYIYYLIEKFAEYGFNRSHAGGYAVFSFEMAFQKTHYPVEFMCTSLNYAKDKLKLKALLEEALRMNIEFLPPDIYKSGARFSVTKDGKIRMGLAGISGIGMILANKIKQITNKNKKKSFKELTILLNDLKGVKMDILIRAGAFDSFGERYDIWQSVKAEKKQKSLDGKSPLLLYVEWETQLLQMTFSDLAKIADSLEESEFLVENITRIKDKKGRAMAFLTVIGKKGRKELVVYYNVWTHIKDKIENGMIIIPTIKGENNATYIKLKGESA